MKPLIKWIDEKNFKIIVKDLHDRIFKLEQEMIKVKKIVGRK